MTDLDSPNLDSLERFAFDPRRVDKPWGWELIWADTDRYVGKLLFVRAGHALSLQFHNEKDESWYLYEGRAKIEMSEAGAPFTNAEVVRSGAAFRLRPGTVHRVRALEDTTVHRVRALEDTTMLEVSTPHLDDVVRLEDAYGREGTSAP